MIDKTPLIDVLDEFSFNLRKLSSTSKTENLEIILPLEQYKQLEYELQGGYISYGPLQEKYNLQDVLGINFTVSCKELNEQLIHKKLNKCFEILKK